MRGLMRRTVVAAAAGVILLGPAVGVASAAGAAAAGTRPATGALTGGTWGKAMEVPGTAALNQGEVANIESVSCARAGYCSAGGYYTDSSGHEQAFLVNEVHGTWRTAEEVPGTAALNTGGNAQMSSVSCAGAGNCSAGGFYTESTPHSSTPLTEHAFVVNEVHGTWRTAEEVPVKGEIYSVSCASAGNCSAGGDAGTASGLLDAFVVDEVRGTWGTAKDVSGLAVRGYLYDAIYSVSCASAGNCSAGGDAGAASGQSQAFVVDEARGTWGTAEVVPGTAALNKGGLAETSSVSCGSVGYCSAGGGYVDSSSHFQAFIVNQVHGTWGTAEEVPGTAALNKGGGAETSSVSCASAGNCSAGGNYNDSSHHYQAFVINEVHGTWRTAEEIPGTAALNQGGSAGAVEMSCAPAGYCSAAGGYVDSSHHRQAFVASEVHGTWRAAEEVPGTAALNQGGFAGLGPVSCVSAGNCSAGGYYTDSSGHQQVFVVSEVQTSCHPPAQAAASTIPATAAAAASKPARRSNHR
jgi:hypothetical protein